MRAWTFGILGLGVLVAARLLGGGKHPLGRTTRKGPRRGTIEVPPEIVDETVDDILTEFLPCPGGLKPPLFVERRRTVAVPDIASGDPISVRVNVFPEWDDPTPGIRGDYSFAITKHGRRPVDQTVNLRPPEAVCDHRSTWRRDLRRTLTHELAHAMDSGSVAAAKRNPVRAHALVDDSSEDAALRAYFNRPSEVAAYLSETNLELEPLAALARQQRWRPEKLLNASATYRKISPYLALKAKRRFQRMAARFYSD